MRTGASRAPWAHPSPATRAPRRPTHRDLLDFLAVAPGELAPRTQGGQQTGVLAFPRPAGPPPRGAARALLSPAGHGDGGCSEACTHPGPPDRGSAEGTGLGGLQGQGRPPRHSGSWALTWPNVPAFLPRPPGAILDASLQPSSARVCVGWLPDPEVVVPGLHSGGGGAPTRPLLRTPRPAAARGPTRGRVCAGGEPAPAASPCSAAAALPAGRASPPPACPAGRWRPSGGRPGGQGRRGL